MVFPKVWRSKRQSEMFVYLNGVPPMPYTSKLLLERYFDPLKQIQNTFSGGIWISRDWKDPLWLNTCSQLPAVRASLSFLRLGALLFSICEIHRLRLTSGLFFLVTFHDARTRRDNGMLCLRLKYCFVHLSAGIIIESWGVALSKIDNVFVLNTGCIGLRLTWCPKVC